jgi:hypothetical protein
VSSKLRGFAINLLAFLGKQNISDISWFLSSLSWFYLITL